MSVRVYLEGGFEGITKTNCRKAFRHFFEKTLPSGSFRVVASGNRRKAFDDFCTALRQYPNDFVVLLVDSEEPVIGSPWEHLARRAGDGWKRPQGADDDRAQLMVQVVESWFLADQDALAVYYGRRFHRPALPRRSNIEQIAKSDVFRALETATRNTQKGEYHKTRHGFDLIGRVDPGLVRAASLHAERLLSVLERETGPA